jgi:hypothetical protein
VELDLILNMVWALLGVLALAAVFIADARERCLRPFHSRVLHLIGTALVVTALFPYISATDDVVQIEHASSDAAQHDKQSSGQHHQGNDLWRLYDANDHSIGESCIYVAPSFSFVSIVVTPVPATAEFTIPQTAGRSPPVLLPA